MTTERKLLSLAEAVEHWGDPALRRARADAYAELARVRSDVQIELSHPTERQLQHFDAFRKSAEMREAALLESCRRMDTLVINDFRYRIETGQLFLAGVPLDAEDGTKRYVLAGHRASAYEFDFELGIVRDGALKFGSLTISQAPPPHSSVFVGQAASTLAVPADKPVRDLTDEELLQLLDEYARRVVEEEGSALKLPVKVSFIPILRRKMRHRFENGENAITLEAEVAALEAWIRSKVDSHQTPKAKHIGNELRVDYRQLKAQHPRAVSKDSES